MQSNDNAHAHDIREGLVGVLGMLVNLGTPLLREARNRWGLAREETQRAHPGDDLVPNPKWMWTHAVEIDAPAAAVWPWVVQIGATKAGFYSYQWLENLVGCNIRNSDQIEPGWQKLRVGDPLILHPKTPPLRVAAIEPGRWFVASSELEPGNDSLVEPEARISWLFFVEPLSARRCRFISRYRVSYGSGLKSRLSYGPLFTESLGFMMDRAMLRGVKRRAEAA